MLFLIKQPILKLLAEYADTLMPSKMILPILITIQTGLIGPVRKLIGLIQQWQERMNFFGKRKHGVDADQKELKRRW